MSIITIKTLKQADQCGGLFRLHHDQNCDAHGCDGGAKIVGAGDRDAQQERADKLEAMLRACRLMPRRPAARSPLPQHEPLDRQPTVQ